MTTEPAVLARYELASFKEHEAAHHMTNHRGFALLPEPLPLVGKHQQTGGAPGRQDLRASALRR